ncbi:ankyrin, partial [Wilcoxina mikolae CBS 423.85]
MARAKHGVTALHRACGYGVDSAIVSQLLEWGSYAKTTTTDGWTALHVASSAGNSLAADLLLAEDVDIDAITISGITPLHCACACGCEKIVRLLLYRGANVTVRDTHGNLALHVAVLYGTPTIVRMLLKSGADIGTIKPDFTTAL